MKFWQLLNLEWGFPCGSDGKELACSAGDVGSILGLGRSSGEGKGYPLQYSHSSVGKESICNAGDLDLIPGLGRSLREGRGYPLQYSGLENSMDCIVHGVAELDMTEQLALICIIHPTSQTWHLCCISLNDYVIKQTHTQISISRKLCWFALRP